MSSREPTTADVDKLDAPKPDMGVDDTAGSLLQGVGASVITGVTIIPLVVPGEKGQSRIIFSKILFQDADSEVVYHSILPIDVLVTLACNIVRGCSTCVESLGHVSDEDMLFLDRTELTKALDDAKLSLQQIRDRFA